MTENPVAGPAVTDAAPPAAPPAADADALRAEIARLQGQLGAAESEAENAADAIDPSKPVVAAGAPYGIQRAFDIVHDRLSAIEKHLGL